MGHEVLAVRQHADSLRESKEAAEGREIFLADGLGSQSTVQQVVDEVGHVGTGDAVHRNVLLLLACLQPSYEFVVVVAVFVEGFGGEFVAFAGGEAGHHFLNRRPAGFGHGQR